MFRSRLQVTRFVSRSTARRLRQQAGQLRTWIQQGFSWLQLGRVFRLLGLPLWTFIGIGVAGWLFDHLALLIQEGLSTLLRWDDQSIWPVLAMLLFSAAIVVGVGAWNSGRHRLVQTGILEEVLQRPSGKKGLVILVSRPESAIFSIEYHFGQGTLERVWLIPSNDRESDQFGPGSLAVAEEIVEFCQELRDPDDPERRVVVEVDRRGVSPGDAQDTFDAVNRIFRRSGYDSVDLIADFTGGTKPMSVGMIMACLPRSRELEYVSFNSQQRQSYGPYLIDYQHSAFDLVA